MTKKSEVMKGKFRNIPCNCGSGKKLKKCCGVQKSHPDDLETRFNKTISKGEIEIKIIMGNFWPLGSL